MWIGDSVSTTANNLVIVWQITGTYCMWPERNDKKIIYRYTQIHIRSLASYCLQDIQHPNISLLIYQSLIDNKLSAHLRQKYGQHTDAFVVSCCGWKLLKPHRFIWKIHTSGKTLLNIFRSEWMWRISRAVQGEFTEGLCANFTPLIKSVFPFWLWE